MVTRTAIESLSPSELILFDNTYKDRLALRTSLLKSHPETVVGIHDDGSDPRIADAVCEYYTFVLGTYLPTRYPNVFNLHRTELVDGSKNHMLENRATGELWPITLTDSKGANGKRSRTRKALENLLRVVDEDILFLLPESSSSGDEKYHLKAYAVAFPSGFDTTKKLGLPLSAIHGPVPGYKDKLERSMDRFFGKLEPGKYVKRSNWTITAGDELFAAFGALHGSEDEGMKELRAEDLDVDSVCTLYLLMEGPEDANDVDSSPLRATDRSSPAQERGQRLCFPYVYLPAQGDQGGRPGGGADHGDRRAERRERAADACL